MISKPIDLMCPVQMVSLDLFNAYYRGLADNDRYYHVAFSLNHQIQAIWHWRRGVWWSCEFVNTLVAVTLEGLRFYERQGYDLSTD